MTVGKAEGHIDKAARHVSRDARSTGRSVRRLDCEQTAGFQDETDEEGRGEEGSCLWALYMPPCLVIVRAEGWRGIACAVAIS